MNKEKLKQLQSKLSKLEEGLPKDEVQAYLDSILKTETANFQKQLKENPTVQFLDSFNKKLDKFKNDFRLDPIISEIEGIQEDVQKIKEHLDGEFERVGNESNAAFKQLSDLVENTKADLGNTSAKEMKAIIGKISSLEDQMSFADSDARAKGTTLKSILDEYGSKIKTTLERLDKSDVDKSTSDKVMQDRLSRNELDAKNAQDAIQTLRKDLFSRLSQIGGGNANRNIAIGGNTSVLSRYTDINIKAGSNVTISYQNNDVTKYLDLTFASTGGGGSVGGVVRSIATTTVSSTVGAAANTDYVVLANGGVKVTLPTAASNQNLYTIKNTGNSSVLIATTGGETIDDGASALLSVQYTSVDLISDSVNWKVT